MSKLTPRPTPAVIENVRMFARLAAALVDRDRPLMVNLIVTRRCNLSCGYCVEYDKVSPPVPLAALKARIDKLAELRTVIVTLTGGETLLHPDIIELVRYVHDRGMVPALNTNAYLLTRAHIEGFNSAGLYAMQISIDNVAPNAVSKKSLRPLQPKLRLLAQLASFRVRINTVLGSGPADEALEVAKAAIAYGFDAKCALLREPSGQLAKLDAHTRAVYDQITKLQGRHLGLLSEDFNEKILRDGELDWKCRAGARFFHVCENGLVHLCTPRYGSPAKPIAAYSVDDIRLAFATQKSCTAKCPVAYAHQASRSDAWRSQAKTENRERRDGRLHLAVV